MQNVEWSSCVNSTQADAALKIRIEITENEDVVIVRRRTRDHAHRLGMTLTDTTKLVTAASELARNALEYGGGGWAEVELVSNGVRRGVQLTVTDEGPGIPDVERALTDGFTSGKGLGLGLGGSRRLVNEFSIESAAGRGTCVRVIRWT
ncbi:MAG: ATP-binding protein [Deltaproteobacteria bacterium]|nr:ATP-binding protein [Deltaproteobacteria bacterium]